MVLSLTDSGFSTGMAKAAAAAKVLDGALDDLDGDLVDVGASTQRTERDVDGLGTALQRSQASVFSYSGQMRILAASLGAIGPALVPISAVAVPAVTGLANQLGAAAGAAGVAVLAFQGVGDALTAVNDAALDPTAENLEKAREAMELLSPAGRNLVGRLHELREPLMELRDTAQAGLFPGLIEGIDHLSALGPSVTRIVDEMASAMGDLAAEGAESLASDRWRDFFTFLGDEARGTLEDLAATAGSFAHGLSEMWMAFQPLNRDFGDWLRQTAADFDTWAQGLSQSNGFQEFINYIRESGPQVAAAMGAIGNAIVQVTQAVAPLGGPVLRVIETFANAVAAIADSPIGTPLLGLASALSAANLASRLFDSSLAALGATSTAASSKFALLARNAGLAFAGFAAVDMIQSDFDGLNATTNELANSLGSMTTGSSLPDDLDNLSDKISRLADPSMAENLQDNISALIGGIGNEDEFYEATASIEALDAALASIASTQGPVSAKAALDDVVDAAGLSGGALADLMDMLPGYRDAMAAAATSNRDLGRGARVAAGAEQALAIALRRSADAATAAFDATTAYRQALKQARQQANNNQAGIRGMSDAALANRQALGQLAGSWNRLVDAGEASQGQMRQARRDFIATATAMGVPIGRARELAREMLKIPEKVESKVDVDVGAALNDIGSVKSSLASIERNIGVRVTVTEYRQDGGRSTKGGLTKADGGTVAKTGLPYADRHPHLLADGEEVISNRHGQADRWRPLLKAINANRLADGGTVRTRQAQLASIATARAFQPQASAGSTTVRHIIDVRVSGEMDMARARGEIVGMARAISRSEIEQQETWNEQRGWRRG